MTGTALSAAQQSALAQVQGLVAGVERVVQTAPSGGGEYLRFGKDGRWSFGADGKAVGKDDAVLLNVLSLQEGYVCWTDNDDEKTANEKLGEVMAPVSRAIDPNTLEDHGYPWRRQQSVDVKFISGPHEGTQTRFITSSGGGLEIMGEVFAKVLERIRQGTPYFFPICYLDEDHYQHKKWGKTYKPVMDIDGWADVDGNEEGADAPEDDAPDTSKEEEAKAAKAAAAAEAKAAKAAAAAAAKAEEEARAKAEEEAQSAPVARTRSRSSAAETPATEPADEGPRRRRR